MSPPVIVIFGAAVRAGGQPSQTLRRRVEAAAAFGARQDSPIYLPTGGVGRYPPSEARVMAELLATFGVPPERIVLEETATDTLSSVRACRRLLHAQLPGARVYLATSAYHLPRCLVLMRLAGVRARACPPPAFPASSHFGKRWRWRLREVPAMGWDVVLMLCLRLSRTV